MSLPLVTYDDFINAASEFLKFSDRLSDGWTIQECLNVSYPMYLKKKVYLQHEEHSSILYNVEYIVSFSPSYSVPMFAFNIWRNSGELMSLDDIRNMSFLRIDEKEFYSVITQQEHPLFFKPYYIVHPCRTEELLSHIKNESKNWLVTFLSLVAPLVQLKLPLELGMIN